MIPFKGRPPPTVMWRKGEKNLGIDERYNIQNTESSTLLIIPQVTRNDTGKYVLTIENGIGEPKSSFVNVKVLDTPSACQKLQLKHVSRGTVTLIWEPPLINGGSEITNYVIEKRDATKRAWSTITTKCSHTTFKVTNLSEKTAFFFRVLAENENGLGEPCETSEPVKPAEVPGPVKDLAMKDSTKTSVTLQWSKPDFDGGSIISDYVIEKKMIEEKEWSHAGISKTCEFEVEKLKELSVMEFRVSAKNEKGLSDAVTVGPITVKDFVITPEVDLSDIFGGQITVRIGHNMHIELPYKGKPRPTMSWLKDNIPLKESEQVRFKKTENKISLSIKNVKKENGGKYTLILDNSVCRKSFTITVITLGPPSKPKGPIRLDEIKADSVVMSWDAPEDNGGGEITSDLGEWHKVNAETCIATKYTVTDLEAGEHYKFRVSAVNGAGKGESCEVPATIQATDRLSSPEIDIDANFKQTHIVRAGATIRLFIAFLGKPVPTATWSKADSDLSLRADIHITDSFSTLTVENCNRNDAGKYVFTVENVSGSKSIAFTVKVLDTPGPPGPITFKDVTRGSITLMWDAPVLDGGARIHHYIVEKREASRRSWQVVSSKCTRQIFKVTDLAEGVPFYYRVSAENEYGVGEPCELTEPVVATEEPAPPKRLDIIDTTKSSAVLAWLKPDHDGGSRVTGYLLEMKQKGSDYWVEAGHTKQLTFTVEGLLENNEYEFRVKAKNDAGYSEPREAFSSVIIKEPQIEPTADLSGITRQLITCKAGSTFTIDIPISGRPAPKVTWKLEEMRLKETDRVTIKTTKDRTTLIVKDSMRGDSGKYYLTLENTAGVKTFAVTVVVIGRPGAVTGPIDISSISAESCVLSWKEPEDDGGTDITNYIVEKRESGTTAWQLINSSVKRTQIKVTHLTKYMEYAFRVSSENRFGSESTGAVTCKDEYCKKHSPGSFKILYTPPKAELDARLHGEIVTIRAGSDLVLDAAIGGKPEPKVFWSKGDKELDLCEKISLQYTSKRAIAVIKYCDRSDSGKYTLTVKNASGTKQVSVLVKVLGMYFIDNGLL
uniref:Titin n=1 Tax=Chrysemys picta bellii TaxID=8478 RepID=A0A8C3H6K2_CHRPI